LLRARDFEYSTTQIGRKRVREESSRKKEYHHREHGEHREERSEGGFLAQKTSDGKEYLTSRTALGIIGGGCQLGKERESTGLKTRRYKDKPKRVLADSRGGSKDRPVHRQMQEGSSLRFGMTRGGG
jgi:hypothetical protein